MFRALLTSAVLVLFFGCGYREPVPPSREHDARFGRLGGTGEPLTKKAICRRWTSAVIGRDSWATTHLSFPETNVQDACFTPVVHTGRDVHVGNVPRGCNYPDG